MTWNEFLQAMQADPQFYALFQQWVKDTSYQGWLEQHAGAALSELSASDFAELFMQELQGDMATPQDIVRMFMKYVDKVHDTLQSKFPTIYVQLAEPTTGNDGDIWIEEPAP